MAKMKEISKAKGEDISAASLISQSPAIGYKKLKVTGTKKPKKKNEKPR